MPISNEKYKGNIVEESLEDSRILNKLTIRGIKITNEENPLERWHIYTVYVTEKEIQTLSKQIKPKWYMHFWRDKKIIVVFKDKTFVLDSTDKTSWNDAIKHGLSLGIPKAQLDFPID